MLGLSVKLYEDSQNQLLSNLKWSVEKPRRHWKLFEHCQDILLPKSIPNVNLLTDESKYYWHIYSSKGKFNKCYQKNLNNSLISTLLKASSQKIISLKYVLISEQLINLDRLDSLSRESYVQKIADFVKKQSKLEIVCFEGLKLTKPERYKLLAALSTSNKSLKFLYIWQTFKRDNYLLSEEDRCSRTLSMVHKNQHWLQAIRNLKFLETISLNYSYIASETGEFLINVAKQLGKNWNYLQLLCLEEEIPGTLNPHGVQNVVALPDFAWNEVQKWSPTLKVQLILLGIPEYDLHMRFMTQSIPVQTIVLSTNLKVLWQKPCMLDCTLKSVFRWYPKSLVQLHLNFWNHREMLDNHLRKLFPSLPNLKMFEFVGEVRDLITICTMCCQIKFRVCGVEKVNMQLQNLTNALKNNNWLEKVPDLLAYFKNDFDTLNVIFEIHCYPF